MCVSADRFKKSDNVISDDSERIAQRDFVKSRAGERDRRIAAFRAPVRIRHCEKRASAAFSGTIISSQGMSSDGKCSRPKSIAPVARSAGFALWSAKNAS
jgi:hypothetical protein